MSVDAIECMHTRIALKRMQSEIDGLRAQLEARPAGDGWHVTRDFDGDEYCDGYNHRNGAWVRKSREPWHAGAPWWWGATEASDCGERDMVATLAEAKERALGGAEGAVGE